MSKVYNIANKESRYYVERLDYFKGSNLFAEERNNNYVVFSYAYHWPLIMFHRQSGIWCINTSKRSVSTSRHLTQARPSEITNSAGCKISKFDNNLIIYLPTDEMIRLMNKD